MTFKKLIELNMLNLMKEFVFLENLREKKYREISNSRANGEQEEKIREQIENYNIVVERLQVISWMFENEGIDIVKLMYTKIYD